MPLGKVSWTRASAEVRSVLVWSLPAKAGPGGGSAGFSYPVSMSLLARRNWPSTASENR